MDVDDGAEVLSGMPDLDRSSADGLFFTTYLDHSLPQLILKLICPIVHVGWGNLMALSRPWPSLCLASQRNSPTLSLFIALLLE